MRRRGPQKHSDDVIHQAIQLSDTGESLSSIARKLGVAKTTVKYWLDNAGKFIAEAGGKKLDSTPASIQARVAGYGWDLLLRVYRKIGARLGDASFQDLVSAMSELHDRMTQFSSLGSQGKIPSRVLEVRKEISLEVREFLDKQKQGQENGSQETAEENQPEGLSGPGEERLLEGTDEGKVLTEVESKPDGNGSNV